MKAISILLTIIVLFASVIIFAESEPKEKKAADCPYMEKMYQQKAASECPYSGKKEMKKEEQVCPYSGKSLQESKDSQNKTDEFYYRKSKELLDQKLKIVFT